MRGLLYAAALILFLIALAPLLRALRQRSVPARPTQRDELVKDPVCQTYVVRARAVQRSAGGEPMYFCSLECARRYAGPA